MKEEVEKIISDLEELKWKYTNKNAIRRIERIILELEELAEMSKYNE